MINLEMPGGRYEIRDCKDLMGLKDRIALMNGLFTQDETKEKEETVQVADEQPRAQEVKQEQQEGMTEMADKEKDPMTIVLENIDQDFANLTEDLNNLKKLLSEPTDSKAVKALEAENEELKKKVQDLETKVSALDALKSLLAKV